MTSVGLPADGREARSRRVAGDADAPAVTLQHVAIETSMNVVSHPRAPVLNPERVDRQRALRWSPTAGLAPADFEHVTEPQRLEQIRRRGCGHHRRRPREAAQRGHIEMIHVCMREEHDVERRQFARPERRRDVAFRSERQRSDAYPDASPERRIRQNPYAEEVDAGPSRGPATRA